MVRSEPLHSTNSPALDSQVHRTAGGRECVVEVVAEGAGGAGIEQGSQDHHTVEAWLMVGPQGREHSLAVAVADGEEGESREDFEEDKVYAEGKQVC